MTNHSFRYVEMISDGDSSAYKSVTDMNVYDEDVKIEKLECVNHAHKRMGTAKRKLSTEERIGGRGKRRLTAAKGKDLQIFIGRPSSTTLGTKGVMNAIWAAQWHSISKMISPVISSVPRAIQVGSST